MLSQLKKGQESENLTTTDRWFLWKFPEKPKAEGKILQKSIHFVEFRTRTTITQKELKAGFYLYYGIFF